jgi:hypothetical protein
MKRGEVYDARVDPRVPFAGSILQIEQKCSIIDW